MSKNNYDADLISCLIQQRCILGFLLTLISLYVVKIMIKLMKQIINYKTRTRELAKDDFHTIKLSQMRLKKKKNPY